MYSIGDLIDKLIIENIKIFNLRQTLHSKNINDEKFVENENKMNIINENRGIIISLLNEKIENVFSKKEKNRILREVKTYANDK